MVPFRKPMPTNPVPSRNPYFRKFVTTLCGAALLFLFHSGIGGDESHRFAGEPDANILFDLEALRIWQRCPLGQNAASVGCTGTSLQISYNAALALCAASNEGEAHWTLPERKDLSGVADCYGKGPSSDGGRTGIDGSRMKGSGGSAGCNIVDRTGKSFSSFPGDHPGPLWFRGIPPGELPGVLDMGSGGGIKDGDVAGVLCNARWDGDKTTLDSDGEKWNDAIMRFRLSRKSEEYRLVLVGSVRSRESRAVWIRAITRYLEPAPGREDRALLIYETLAPARRNFVSGAGDSPLHGETERVVTIPGLRVALVFRKELLSSADSKSESHGQPEPEIWKYSSGDWYLALRQP